MHDFFFYKDTQFCMHAVFFVITSRKFNSSSSTASFSSLSITSNLCGRKLITISQKPPTVNFTTAPRASSRALEKISFFFFFFRETRF